MTARQLAIGISLLERFGYFLTYPLVWLFLAARPLAFLFWVCQPDTWDKVMAMRLIRETGIVPMHQAWVDSWSKPRNISYKQTIGGFGHVSR